ncbi:MAG: hypothetical protein LBJ41_00430 [Treponema sp.]|nr:hypothetical protein [Treponema sp.]
MRQGCRKLGVLSAMGCEERFVRGGDYCYYNTISIENIVISLCCQVRSLHDEWRRDTDGG